jgi:hypothetical protein
MVARIHTIRAVAVLVLALLLLSCSRGDRTGQTSKEFDHAMRAFLEEASKLSSMTEADTKQPEFEEQLKVVEAAFVKADRMWPEQSRYAKARELFKSALDGWRACNELRVAVLLGRISASANSQVAMLAQDRRLGAKSRTELDRAHDDLSELHLREARASHDLEQGRAYVDGGGSQ